MNKLSLIAVSAVVLASQTGAALADPGGRYWDDHMMGWGGWWFGPVMMLVVLAVLVLAVIGLARLFSGGRSGSTSSGTDASLEILRERFARGEIDEEEFEARKRALTR